jgi:serine/threonine protein kinase
MHLNSEEREVCSKVTAFLHPKAAAGVQTDQVAWRTFYRIGIYLSNLDPKDRNEAYIKKWRGSLFSSYATLFQPTDTGIDIVMILRRIYKSPKGDKKVYKALNMNTGEYEAVTMWPDTPKNRREREIPSKLEIEKCPHLVAPYRLENKITKYKKIDNQEAFKILGVNCFYPDTLDRRVLLMNEHVQILLAVLKGVKHLHDRGYAHRDVKPSNIFYSSEGAKLGDFGLVCRLGEINSAGTCHYASPETVYGRGVVTEKCAVWEIGITGLELMGYPVRDNKFLDLKKLGFLTDKVVVKMVDEWLPQRVVTEAVTDLDGHLLAIYRSCLKVNPEDRPSVEELIVQFEKLIEPEASYPSSAKAAEG